MVGGMPKTYCPNVSGALNEPAAQLLHPKVPLHVEQPKVPYCNVQKTNELVTQSWTTATSLQNISAAVRGIAHGAS